MTDQLKNAWDTVIDADGNNGSCDAVIEIQNWYASMEIVLLAIKYIYIYQGWTAYREPNPLSVMEPFSLTAN